MNTPETNTPAIEISDLACTFISGDGKKESHYTAVRDVNLSIRAGEFVSIVGPTGCGKSTILNMTAGLLKPSHGTIRIFAEPRYSPITAPTNAMPTEECSDENTQLMADGRYTAVRS